MSNKNFKQLIMSTLYMEKNMGLPTEALEWVASNLPDSNEEGSFAKSNPGDIEHLWDDFKGFKNVDMKAVPEGIAVNVSGKTLMDILAKLSLSASQVADSPTFKEDKVDEMTVLNLTKKLSKEELAFIVLTGVGAFTHQMRELQKENLWRNMQRGGDFNL